MEKYWLDFGKGVMAWKWMFNKGYEFNCEFVQHVSFFLISGSSANVSQAFIDIFKQDIKKHSDPKYAGALATAEAWHAKSIAEFYTEQREINQFLSKGKESCLCGKK